MVYLVMKKGDNKECVTIEETEGKEEYAREEEEEQSKVSILIQI